MSEQQVKWISLRGIGTTRPQYGIEGLTVNEAVVWLRELIRLLKKRGEFHEMDEYFERSCGS